MIATPITAEAPSRFSKIMRELHDQPSPYRATGRSASHPRKLLNDRPIRPSKKNLRGRQERHFHDDRAPGGAPDTDRALTRSCPDSGLVIDQKRLG
jgi:hypothetical protein